MRVELFGLSSLHTLARTILVLAIGAVAVFPVASQTTCTVPDNGTGSVDLPPSGCGYVSPQDLHRMINGLPPGTEIHVSAKHNEFFNVTHHPGGSLGGEVENFQSNLVLNLQGTGTLSGYTRLLNIQAVCEAHTGPHGTGSPQSFDNDMFALQGQLPPGDPDFDLLRITAGTNFSMPSPGHTTLTQLPGGNWNVDSFFDITYRIDFVGHSGGPFGGMSGSTTGTIRMQGGTPAPNPLPCTVPDNGSGTVNLPPAGCGYVSPQDLHKIINGLPPGTEIHVAAEHERFFNVTTSPGGSLGGEVETFSSNLKLTLTGGGLNRVLNLPVNCQTHIGPRTPGAAVQSFDNEMHGLQGQLPAGDPDFDLLRITAGSAFGMPSPGHTTLTRLTGGNWNVDSFFDITYRIDFVGHPGGPLGGMSGSTTGTIKMKAGQPKATLPTCFNPDNGTGTVNLPPAGCGYLSPADVHKILQGLPAGTQVNLGAQHARFFNVTRQPGGSLGGEIENFSSNLVLKLEGSEGLSGWSRMVSVPIQCQTHVGPRTPGQPVQTFPTDMFMLQGQITGDPDFDLLRILGGTGNGMPSPGQTTLTKQTPGTSWAVDSFFDITYRIDFVGAPGGHLGGMSGSTTATIRMQSAAEVFPPAGPVTLTLDQLSGGSLLTWSPVPNAAGYDVVCGSLAQLRSSGGDFSIATNECLENDQPSTASPYAAIPPVGNGVWCVVRAENIAGNGTYDEGGAQVGARDAEIQASGMACP